MESHSLNCQIAFIEQLQVGGRVNIDHDNSHQVLLGDLTDDELAELWGDPLPARDLDDFQPVGGWAPADLADDRYAFGPRSEGRFAW
jgi:hypothetical protein